VTSELRGAENSLSPKRLETGTSASNTISRVVIAKRKNSDNADNRNTYSRLSTHSVDSA